MSENNVVDRANELLAKIDQRPWMAETEFETWCDAGDDGRTIGGYTGETEETGAIIVENKDEDGTVTYIADRVWDGNFAFVLAAPDLVRGLIAEVEQRTSHLATVTAGRDELASTLEAAERVAKPNGEEAKAANERAEKETEAVLDQANKWMAESERMRERNEQLVFELFELRSDPSWNALIASQEECNVLRAGLERSGARAKVMRSALDEISKEADAKDARRIAREALQEPSND